MEILLGAKEENIMNGATSKTDLSVHTLKKLYDRIVYPRLIEEKMLNLLRQGKISKWFSGIGQEAISVGVDVTWARAALRLSSWNAWS